MLAIQMFAAVSLYAWIEYGIHRFDMHRPGSYRFESHTIAHHGRGGMAEDEASLTQTNVGSVFWLTLPLTIPIAWVWGWSFICCWAALLFWAGFTWTAVHRHIHGEPGYRYAYLLCPWLRAVRWNHLRHHACPRRAYGGLFFFLTDPIAGTL